MRPHGGEGKTPRQLTYEDYLELRGRGVVKFPEVVKLYLKCLYKVTGEERYMKLYNRIGVPKRKTGFPKCCRGSRLQGC